MFQKEKPKQKPNIVAIEQGFKPEFDVILQAYLSFE